MFDLVKLLKESVIDPVRSDLSPEIWKKDGGTYVMHDDVKQTILDMLDRYPLLDLRDLAQKIRITGSICTDQYTNTADIDVHLIIDPNDLESAKTPQDWQKDVIKYFRGEGLEMIGLHPIEVYLQYDPTQEDVYADAVYDLMTDTWEKDPLINRPGYDPIEDYKDAYAEMQSIVADTDDALSELRRDVIDFDVLKSSLADTTPTQRTLLKKHMQEKLDEITASIEELAEDREAWSDMRKKSSSPDSAKADIEKVRQWKDKNAVFKFLQRYQYMRIIKALEEFIDERKVDGGDVEKIQDILGVGDDGAESKSIAAKT